MNNLNSVLLEGNLTRDPELEKEGSVTCCLITLESNRYIKQDAKYETEKSYFEIKAYAKLAGVCMEYLKEGRGVRVIGRLKQEKWDETIPGVTGVTTVVKKVVVIAEHIEFKNQENKRGNY